MDKEITKRRTVFSIIGRVILITAIIFVLLVLLSGSPLFSISEIEISGVEYYNKEHIIEKSGLAIGQNGFKAIWSGSVMDLLTLKCGDAERNIVETCPYVKNVKTKYKLPDKIVIEVEERSKSVIIPYQDLGLLVDEEGFVIDVIKNYQDSGLPVIKGVSFDKYSLGQRLAVDNEQYLEMVIALISALRQSDRESEDKLTYVIDFIDISDLKSIKLFIGDEFVVYLGDGTEMYYRISALNEMYFKSSIKGERGIIDFTAGGPRPIFIPETVVN